MLFESVTTTRTNTNDETGDDDNHVQSASTDPGDDGDDGALNGPRISAYVDLAQRVGRWKIKHWSCYIILISDVVRTRTVSVLADELQLPTFPELLRRFLYDQVYSNNVLSSSQVPLSACPSFSGQIRIYNSAVATFYAPSDPSGSGGMRREYIRATPSWRKGQPRYDCVFLSMDAEVPGMLGMAVARVRLFFSLYYEETTYPCALVDWYTRFQDSADEDTGLWVVQPELDATGNPVTSIIHLDCVICAAHLLAIFGDEPVPKTLKFHQTLDSFQAFYVNKYIDHHAFDLLTPELH
jgi:hypothetical protein